jgi:hypothetical protein
MPGELAETGALAETQPGELVLPNELKGELAEFKETTQVREIAGLLKREFNTIKKSNMLEHFGINIKELELTELPDELSSLTVENVVNQMKSGMVLALTIFLPKDIQHRVYSMSQLEITETFAEALKKKKGLEGGMRKLDEVKNAGKSITNFFRSRYNAGASIGATALFMAKFPFSDYITGMEKIFEKNLLGLNGVIDNMPAYMGMSFIFCAQKVKKLTDCYKSIKERKTENVCECAVKIVSDLLLALGVSVLPDHLFKMAQNASSYTPDYYYSNFIALTIIQEFAESGCKSLKSQVNEPEGGSMKRKRSKRKSKRSKRRAKRRSKISRRKSRK